MLNAHTITNKEGSNETHASLTGEDMTNGLIHAIARLKDPEHAGMNQLDTLIAGFGSALLTVGCPMNRVWQVCQAADPRENNSVTGPCNLCNSQQ